MNAGGAAQFEVPAGYTAALFVLKGKIQLASGEHVSEAELAVLETEGSQISFQASTNATLLLLNGQPINEPRVAYGPFVMNSPDEIRQAFADYENGKMGSLSD